MKNSTLISMMVCAAIACTGKKRADAHGGDATADAPAPSGDASWSATLDGVAVTGAGVDQLQQENSAYLLPVGGPKQHLVFYIYSTKNGADQSANTSFRFWVPPGVGTYAQKGYTEHSCDCSVTLNEGIASGQELMRFNSDTVTVTVTSMTSARVAGTFSGIFTLSGDTPRAPKKKVRITDGKFDLPMSTSKITPE